jgi:Kef-type K+ transport system membrane component KefB
MSIVHGLPLGHFFLQLGVILLACRVCSMAMRKVGQPAIIGEMIAGIVLGPSLLGALAPGVSGYLFPAASKPILFDVAQLGLSLYMFVVGLEFRGDLLRSRLRSAASISFAGMAAPFALGALLSLWIGAEGGFYSEGISPGLGMVFTGAAMCVTAFPMLARIIKERGLAGATAGTLALASGSIDDVAAWILLAGVIATVSGNFLLVLWTIGGAVAYVVFCRFVVPRFFSKAMENEADFSRGMSLLLILLVLGSWFTDKIQLYAVFGAFILGVCVPRGPLADHAIRKIGPLTTLLLLPVFFTYSGLNTRLDLLNSVSDWAMAGAVVLAAVAGKMGACYLAARWCGEPHGDALTVASLMNTRGLMELILLNIGLQAGIITPRFFTMMVVMAVVTTLMTAPLFEFARRRAQSKG